MMTKTITPLTAALALSAAGTPFAIKAHVPQFGHHGELARQLATPSVAVPGPHAAPDVTYGEGGIFTAQLNPALRRPGAIDPASVPAAITAIAADYGVEAVGAASLSGNVDLVQGWQQGHWVSLRIDGDTERLVGAPVMVPSQS